MGGSGGFGFLKSSGCEVCPDWKKKIVVGVPGIAKSSVVLDQAPQWVWGLLKQTKKKNQKKIYT